MRTHGCLASAFIGLLIAAASLSAQNLVLDPGLEDTLKCPMSIGRFYHPTNTNEQYLASWRATTLASPDYHNTCGFNGYQPRTGEGYAGIILYDPTEYREYITALLSTPMQQGQCYYIECWVALSSGSTMAVDEFQFHFSSGVPLSMLFPPPGPLALTAHLQAQSAPTSTSYQHVCGFYTAAGGEDAMTFGNFQDNANTTLTQVSGVGQIQSYYYIDDVTVTLLDLGPNTLLCAGEQATIVPNVQCDELTYTWGNGSNAQTLTTGTAGIVTLTISGNGTCAATDNVTITVDPCAGIDDVESFSASSWPSALHAGEPLYLSTPIAIEVHGIFSAEGRYIRGAQRVSVGTVTLDTAHLAAGSYVLDTSVGMFRFVVE